MPEEIAVGGVADVTAAAPGTEVVVGAAATTAPATDASVVAPETPVTPGKEAPAGEETGAETPAAETPGETPVETLETIVATENARIAAERTASEVATQATAPAASAAQPAAAPATTVATPSFSETWKTERAVLEESWKLVDAPGEKVLAGVIDKLVAHLDASAPILADVQAYQKQAFEAGLRAESESYVAASVAVAADLKAEFGLDLTPLDVLGYASHGGLQALASLEGKPLDSYRGRITKETMRTIFELKNRDLVARLRSAPKATPAVKPARELHAGGGARNSDKPLTPLEQIRADRLEGRAAQKAR